MRGVLFLLKFWMDKGFTSLALCHVIETIFDIVCIITVNEYTQLAVRVVIGLNTLKCLLTKRTAEEH